MLSKRSIGKRRLPNEGSPLWISQALPINELLKVMCAASGTDIYGSDKTTEDLCLSPWNKQTCVTNRIHFSAQNYR